VFGAGRPPGVDGGQLLEPVAFQAVQQPPQPKDPLGPDGVGEPVQVLGGQLLDRCREGREPAGWPVECVFESMGGNLSSPHPKASTKPQSGDKFCVDPTQS
jgi:hypothetical protein